MLAATSRNLVLTHLTSFLRTTCRFLNNRSILVVIEKTTEGDCYHFLDDVFLVDKLKLAVYLLHIRSNLLIINISLHDVVHHLIELLLAYLFRCRQVTIYKVFTNLLFYLANLPLFLCVDNADRCTISSCTTCTSRTVSVALYIIWQTIVDDMCEFINIKTTCSHISSYKELHIMIAEFLHGEVALLLTQITMKSLGIISVLDQFIGYLLSFYLCATEDDCKNTWMIIYYTLQSKILVLAMNKIIDVINVFGTFITATYNNLFVVVKIFLGNSLHLLTHSSRE